MLWVFSLSSPPHPLFFFFPPLKARSPTGRNQHWSWGKSGNWYLQKSLLCLCAAQPLQHTLLCLGGIMGGQVYFSFTSVLPVVSMWYLTLYWKHFQAKRAHPGVIKTNNSYVNPSEHFFRLPWYCRVWFERREIWPTTHQLESWLNQTASQWRLWAWRQLQCSTACIWQAEFDTQFGRVSVCQIPQVRHLLSNTAAHRGNRLLPWLGQEPLHLHSDPLRKCDEVLSKLAECLSDAMLSGFLYTPISEVPVGV